MARINRTALYRFYDSEELLLYVGITTRVDRRFEQHKRSKSWFNLAARIEIEYYETRGEALAAEAHAIQSEEPLFNIIHRRHGLDCLIRRCHVCRQPMVIEIDPDDDFYDGFHRHLDCDLAFTDAYQAGLNYADREARRG